VICPHCGTATVAAALHTENLFGFPVGVCIECGCPFCLDGGVEARDPTEGEYDRIMDVLEKANGSVMLPIETGLGGWGEVQMSIPEPERPNPSMN
jgi:hypothetical protein